MSIQVVSKELKTPKYSFSNVKKMEPLFDNLVQQWIDKISADIASKEGTLDLNSWSK